MRTNSVPQGKIRILRLSIALKLGSNVHKGIQGNTFVTDLFKTFLGQKICEEFHPHIFCASSLRK